MHSDVSEMVKLQDFDSCICGLESYRRSIRILVMYTYRSDTNRPIKAEEVTVSEAKSIPEIAAEYGRTHKIELPTIPGQTGGKPRITAMASEVWMEGYIACEEEKNLIIEELTAEKDRIIEEQKKAINVLQRQLEVLKGAYNKLVKEHNEVLRQTVRDLK